MGALPGKVYGEGRTQTSVSYGEIERAAIAILKSERRPTVDTVREALGRGSNGTIGEGLRRFWRDLGARMEGDPAALTRMPAEIAEFADGVWQRALKLAGEAASQYDNAARERLQQLQIENEIRQRSYELREREIDTQARERERALAEARDHLLSLSKALSRAQAAKQANEVRIAALETLVEQYRCQLAALTAATSARNRARRRQESGTRRLRRPPRAAKGGHSVKATPRPAAIKKTLRSPSRNPVRKSLERKIRRLKDSRKRYVLIREPEQNDPETGAPATGTLG
jgi:hypothetical protein